RCEGTAFNLIQNFLDVVSQMGCKKVYLITKPINQKAISFYKKLGFNTEVPDSKIVKFVNLNLFKDYDGFGEHMIVFVKNIE
ncbi:MAG: GNAT family N-acetyltransferase, partial [Methanobacteriaceae archaeon]|nr:GNAT family N-acetyltransferase [Methanobacteriaceae archaeon]